MTERSRPLGRRASVERPDAGVTKLNLPEWLANKFVIAAVGTPGVSVTTTELNNGRVGVEIIGPEALRSQAMAAVNFGRKKIPGR